MPTAEEQKNQLITEADNFRAELLPLLKEVNNYNLRLFGIFNNRLNELNTKYLNEYEKFIVFEDRVSTLITTLNTAQQIATPQGNERISLNTQFEFSIYSSQLNSKLDILKNIFKSIDTCLSDKRFQKNNLIINTVAILTLLIALISLFVSIFLNSGHQNHRIDLQNHKRFQTSPKIQ